MKMNEIKKMEAVKMATHRAAAPEMISMSSLVMTACLVRLKVSVSLSIISATGQREEEEKKSRSSVLARRTQVRGPGSDDKSHMHTLTFIKSEIIKIQKL